MKSTTKLWVGKLLFILPLGMTLGNVWDGLNFVSVLIGISMVVGFTMILENLNKK